jgi:transcription elongation factor Elf1
MLVNLSDGQCRSCGGQLEIIDADDATLLVQCVNCQDSYEVETDAFGDGCMHYYVSFMASRLSPRQKGGEDSTV